MTVYLASRSPRRAELLDQVAIPFELIDAPVDETRGDGEKPLAYVERLAVEKAAAGFKAANDRNAQVIGADTIVVVDGDVFGKPSNEREALAHLSALSGRVHEVFTAVAVSSVAGTRVRVVRSRVWFRALTDAEMRWYWRTGEPADKAGSYAVQGLAARFISRLEGSYSAVMGLPVYETAELLGATPPAA